MNSRTSVSACSDDARRVGSHVGDEADGAFARQLDALVELLRDHHRLLDREARRLLQLAGDERRNRALLALLGRDRRDDPVRLLQVGEDGVRFGLVADLDVRAVLLEELGVELRRHRPGQPRREVPVLLGDERADLALAIARPASARPTARGRRSGRGGPCPRAAG